MINFTAKIAFSEETAMRIFLLIVGKTLFIPISDDFTDLHFIIYRASDAITYRARNMLFCPVFTLKNSVL